MSRSDGDQGRGRHPAGPVDKAVEFSVVVVLPDEGPHGAIVQVLYCDVCRRWGPLGTVHLCGVNWHDQLGQLLATLERGGDR
jgi:hypothetical protein